MADFNKISVNSSLTVIPTNFAALCFNDNILLTKNRYGIENNTLNLLTDTTDTVTIFSNNGIANVYEFESVRLNVAGITLPKLDSNNNELDNLSQNKVLVFVDGKLQPNSAYTVVDTTTLRFNINYTNDYNKLFRVSIYASTTNFQRISYTQDQITRLNSVQEDLHQNRIVLPLTYEVKNTFFIINEHKVPFNAVEILNDACTEVQLNIPESLESDVELFEIIKFTDNSTSSINFATQQGYLTYGPYDDLGKKIPNTYDVILRFTDQVKLLIDNARPGFLLKEKNGFGEAIIVDNNFESMEVKALTIQAFPYSSYTTSEYYIEVPEYKSIVDYLAEFDKKYEFLPEILGIFQRLLLDEINDTIERLRDIRSIGKVDSVHINKLIKLLGFDINIKQLNKKQRRELIEELTEFYRIAGTRNSYNLINILQNNLKLISADQLFTPSGLQARSKAHIYDYQINLEEGGDGYAKKDALAVGNVGLVAKVTDIQVTDPETNTGVITAIELETPEGYNNISGAYDLKSILDGTFKVNSTPKLYSYNWTLSDLLECTPDMVLYSSEKTYGVKILNIDGNNVTFERLCSKYNPNEDIYNVNFNKLQLYRVIDNYSATITSIPVLSSRDDYGEPIYINNAGGQDFSIPLNPGTYLIKISGAGGGGGAGDSQTGNEYDLPATDGYCGEIQTKVFTLEEAGILTGKIGQGGGNVKARGHDPRPYNNVLGNGYHKGLLGELLNVTTPVWRGFYVSYGNIAGGQGGGSTAICDPKGNLIIEARGGNGGSASGNRGEHVSGGLGGNGGYTGSPLTVSSDHVVNTKADLNNYDTSGLLDGTLMKVKTDESQDNKTTIYQFDLPDNKFLLVDEAAKGGSRAYGGDFWSKNGENGWVKIYRIPLDYNLVVNGDTSLIGDEETWETLESTPSFKIIKHRSTQGEITFELQPSSGYYGCNNTFNLKSESDDASAKLTVASTVSLWEYNVKLNADSTYISEESTFINSDSPISQQFIFTVTKDNSTEGTWVPKQGIEKITFENEPAHTRKGTGASVVITSSKTRQKNEDRCYIDFYKKDELFDKAKGEGSFLEFRPITVSYGTITEGTPNSPKFWEVGLPDIVYGTIAEGSENSPDTSHADQPDIAYGEILWDTEGEWVEYWKWDREKIWYPTNHVDLEMKLPPGVNFSEYVDTFVEQFYNLASTVVFIHQITESFYFGNDTNVNYNSTVTSDDGLIGDSGAMTAPFGIVSTMPLMEYEAIMTSDPNRQYINPIGYDFNVTIIPRTPNATVKVIVENVTNNGTIVQTITPLTEADNWTTKIQYGTTITYQVEAPGYITKDATLVVDKNIIKHVALESKTPVEPKYCRLTLFTLPKNANVTFTTNNVTTTKSHTIYAWEGNTIFYKVSYPGYITQEGSIVITEDTDINIELVSENG